MSCKVDTAGGEKSNKSGYVFNILREYYELSIIKDMYNDPDTQEVPSALI
jgi:hypothetical protein